MNVTVSELECSASGSSTPQWNCTLITTSATVVEGSRSLGNAAFWNGVLYPYIINVQLCNIMTSMVLIRRCIASFVSSSCTLLLIAQDELVGAKSSLVDHTGPSIEVAQGS